MAKAIIKYNGTTISEITSDCTKTLLTNGKLLNGNIEVVFSSSRLPSGYTELEYVISTGTQYILTGVNPNNNSRVIVEFKNTSYGSPSALFGARDATTLRNFNLWITSELYGAQYNGNDWTSNQKYIDIVNKKYTADFNKNICTVAGVSATFTSATFSCSYPIAILAVNSGGSVDERRSAGYLYSAKIYSNGTLVRDFIPAKRISDSKVGLYDIINNSFYLSASGNFSAGSEIEY